MIHNYAPLALLTCLFALPYLKLLPINPAKTSPVASTKANSTITAKPKLFALLMLPLGFLFGMSTTITPIAVLATIIIYILIQLIKHKKISRPPLWFFTGLASLTIGFIISFFLSPGMNSYATNPTSAETFDYIAISDIFMNPAAEIPHVFSHLVYNFSLFLVPFVIYFIVAFIAAHGLRTPLKNLKKTGAGSGKIILVFTIFIILHILATAQIKTPPRILIPAYLAGIILIAHLFAPHIKSKIFATGIIVLTVSAIVIHTTFLIIYHHKTSVVLSEIKSSEASTLCIDRSRIEAPRIPVINLSQEFILVDWGYPEYIYGKAITFCPD